MAHRRTQIREAVFDLVNPIDGLNVSKSRVHNFQPSELPAASVYTLSESSPPTNLSKMQERTLRLVVDIRGRSVVDVDTDIDTELDELCVPVEKAIAADFKLGNLAQSVFLMETTIGLTGEGDARNGLARLEYDIKYRTPPDQPDI